jgi:putative ABC transport system ATP-binding protein
MLELDRARKYYASPGGAVHAVDEVSMRVDTGELVALFGPSGSGKTTLLLLAAGLMRADSGRVSFDGADLAQMTKAQLLAYRRTELGFVFQDFNLVAGLTAQENAALPLLLRGDSHRDARSRALALLGEVGLSDRAGHTPGELSGGERQRLAIARALVGEPRLILADEPTGNLDTHTGEEVLALLGALPLKRGAGVLLVSHDPRVAARADRVLTLRDGRIEERAGEEDDGDESRPRNEDPGDDDGTDGPQFKAALAR